VRAYLDAVRRSPLLGVIPDKAGRAAPRRRSGTASKMSLLSVIPGEDRRSEGRGSRAERAALWPLPLAALGRDDRLPWMTRRSPSSSGQILLVEPRAIRVAWGVVAPYSLARYRRNGTIFLTLRSGSL
jgi:hypothetical protein